ncbi:MAG: hypothetical protein J7L96_01770 [Bacteroidales bacterium]|nr:hypothetical protein [Bacteroidales bacterium]
MQIKIIETPRDGMQGMDQLIPAKTKIEYINLLLKCGFDTVEVGSFVSPKAIPQMADTGEVLDNIDLSDTKSKIAVLVANTKGARSAVEYDQVDEIFYPFSTSPTFLKKNLNTNFEKAERTIDEIQDLCVASNKELVAFISLAFGDPYGDPWNADLVNHWVEKLVMKGVKKIPLADTIGDVTPDVIAAVCQAVVPNFPDIEFGLHTHAFPGKGLKKIDAAWQSGIRRFDTVINGLGGCPMTDKELVGNLALEVLINYCQSNNIDTGIDPKQLVLAQTFSSLSL